MEQIRIFRSITVEEIERNANHWLDGQQDIEVLHASIAYEPPRPSDNPNVIPDQEAWVLLLTYRQR